MMFAINFVTGVSIVFCGVTTVRCFSSDEVAFFNKSAEVIIEHALKNYSPGIAYKWMANLSDSFGGRKIGSEALERAINRTYNELYHNYKFDLVHLAKVPNLTNWIRGDATVAMVKPFYKRLNALALGGSTGIAGQMHTSIAIVARSFDELSQFCADVKIANKIVVFNPPWTNYSDASRYRYNAAAYASQCAAAAVLVRSATTYSLNTPHTGQMNYVEYARKIPALAITAEDADFLERMQETGQEIKISYNVTATTSEELANSSNILFDITDNRTDAPKEGVMLSCHMDSWDVGSGAVDDAGGCAVILQAMLILKDLVKSNKLPPMRRAVRAAFWTAEEQGMVGSRYYHGTRNPRDYSFKFLMESDKGLFSPLALEFCGSAPAKQFFKDFLMPTLSRWNFSLADGKMVDMKWWSDEGVPGVMLASSGAGFDRYFHYHHSPADTPSAYKPDDFVVPAASFAVLAYLTANLPRFPDGWMGENSTAK